MPLKNAFSRAIFGYKRQKSESVPINAGGGKSPAMKLDTKKYDILPSRESDNQSLGFHPGDFNRNPEVIKRTFPPGDIPEMNAFNENQKLSNRRFTSENEMMEFRVWHSGSANRSTNPFDEPGPRDVGPNSISNRRSSHDSQAKDFRMWNPSPRSRNPFDEPLQGLADSHRGTPKTISSEAETRDFNKPFRSTYSRSTNPFDEPCRRDVPAHIHRKETTKPTENRVPNGRLSSETEKQDFAIWNPKSANSRNPFEDSHQRQMTAEKQALNISHGRLSCDDDHISAVHYQPSTKPTSPVNIDSQREILVNSRKGSVSVPSYPRHLNLSPSASGRVNAPCPPSHDDNSFHAFDDLVSRRRDDMRAMKPQSPDRKIIPHVSPISPAAEMSPLRPRNLVPSPLRSRTPDSPLSGMLLPSLQTKGLPSPSRRDTPPRNAQRRGSARNSPVSPFHHSFARQSEPAERRTSLDVLPTRDESTADARSHTPSSQSTAQELRVMHPPRRHSSAKSSRINTKRSSSPAQLSRGLMLPEMDGKNPVQATILEFDRLAERRASNPFGDARAAQMQEVRGVVPEASRVVPQSRESEPSGASQVAHPPQTTSPRMLKCFSEDLGAPMTVSRIPDIPLSVPLRSAESTDCVVAPTSSTQERPSSTKSSEPVKRTKSGLGRLTSANTPLRFAADRNGTGADAVVNMPFQSAEAAGYKGRGVGAATLTHELPSGIGCTGSRSGPAITPSPTEDHPSSLVLQSSELTDGISSQLPDLRLSVPLKSAESIDHIIRREATQGRNTSIEVCVDDTDVAALEELDDRGPKQFCDFEALARSPLTESRRVPNMDDPNKCTFWVTDADGLCEHLEIDVENSQPAILANEFLTNNKEELRSDQSDRLLRALQIQSEANLERLSNEPTAFSSRNCMTPNNKKSRRRKLKASLSFRSNSGKSRMRRTFSFSSVR